MLCVMAMEECAELSFALSKCVRFGEESVCPTTGRANYTAVLEEFNDLFTIMEILKNNVLKGNPLLTTERTLNKKKKLDKFLKVSESLGKVKL